MSIHQPKFESYQLSDRYNLETGRVFMTGTQALVRILFDQARRDRLAGLSTGGFVSGYRGSPLGGLDMELWRQKQRLVDNGIEFQPAVNEDLAATALLGSQQVESDPNKKVDGVFGLWYGKGPGVDRSGDALKHGNAYGSSPRGGALVVAGDDHGCVSSSMPHQSDAAFLSWFMPVLNPATVSEYLEFGEYGYALSRYSGMWVGFKAISETVESGQSFDLRADRRFVEPDFIVPASGLHYRWPDLPGPQIEERMEHKKHAVFAFADANPIDRLIHRTENARFGFVTTGKAHLDLMEALRLVGLDEVACRRMGIDVYKVGMVWPLARKQALDFVRDKTEVVVVEEKRGIIESQLKEYFYDWPGDKPGRMVGKNDENGDRLIPWTGELSPLQLAPLIARRLDRVFPEEGLLQRAIRLTEEPAIRLQVEGADRTPYFCSGCPHNTSTKVPEGSRALAGIGCHFMASWMDRDTSSLIQMGGEGVNWAASSKFTSNGHVFQNLGEGTWYHSGSMAIRQAIAADATITYKILYNDAVAMTGGQPVDGPVSVQAIAHICRAEGVERIALVSDDPEKFSSADFPSRVTIHHRRELDQVQRDLREVSGVSVLIYEQACATEKRRRRKRGEAVDPARYAVINPLVCEGCGDCSVESNCLSIEPLETEFGRKRQINLSNCNKDFSCLDGFCPSFVTVEGDVRLRKQGADLDLERIAVGLPDCEPRVLDKPYDLLVTGVGGTGVVTVGALITMAAHLENKGASVLDFTGFAQKFGSVLSYIRLAATPGELNQVRIDRRQADALIGCDLVVSSSPKASFCYRPGTRAVLNSAVMPTGDLVQRRDADLQIDRRRKLIEATAGRENVHTFDANAASARLLGDQVFANVMMLGFAWQMGHVPVSRSAVLGAIELNGIAIEKNKAAFTLGRVMAWKPEALSGDLIRSQDPPTDLETIVARRTEYLCDYQDSIWARRYKNRVTAFAQNTADRGSGALAVAAAKSLFKLMSYKDEYEVARLHSTASFLDGLSKQFDGNFSVKHHLAPPLLARSKDARGRPGKRAFGTGVRPLFSLLTKLKGLRGTALDPFGYSRERREERELIVWFEELMARCIRELTQDNASLWEKVLSEPMEIRGYGPVKAQAIALSKRKVSSLLDDGA